MAGEEKLSTAKLLETVNDRLKELFPTPDTESADANKEREAKMKVVRDQIEPVFNKELTNTTVKTNLTKQEAIDITNAVHEELQKSDFKAKDDVLLPVDGLPDGKGTVTLKVLDILGQKANAELEAIINDVAKKDAALGGKEYSSQIDAILEKNAERSLREIAGTTARTNLQELLVDIKKLKEADDKLKPLAENVSADMTGDAATVVGKLKEAMTERVAVAEARKIALETAGKDKDGKQIELSGEVDGRLKDREAALKVLEDGDKTKDPAIKGAKATYEEIREKYAKAGGKKAEAFDRLLHATIDADRAGDMDAYVKWKEASAGNQFGDKLSKMITTDRLQEDKFVSETAQKMGAVDAKDGGKGGGTVLKGAVALATLGAGAYALFGGKKTEVGEDGQERPKKMGFIKATVAAGLIAVGALAGLAAVRGGNMQGWKDAEGLKKLSATFNSLGKFGPYAGRA